MREKKISCISGSFSVSHNNQGGKNRFFRNYNIFAQILYSYLGYIDGLFDEFFLLLVVILSEFHEKPQRKD